MAALRDAWSQALVYLQTMLPWLSPAFELWVFGDEMLTAIPNIRAKRGKDIAFYFLPHSDPKNDMRGMFKQWLKGKGANVQDDLTKLLNVLRRHKRINIECYMLTKDIVVQVLYLAEQLNLQESGIEVLYHGTPVTYEFLWQNLATVQRFNDKHVLREMRGGLTVKASWLQNAGYGSCLLCMKNKPFIIKYPHADGGDHMLVCKKEDDWQRLESFIAESEAYDREKFPPKLGEEPEEILYLVEEFHKDSLPFFVEGVATAARPFPECLGAPLGAIIFGDTRQCGAYSLKFSPEYMKAFKNSLESMILGFSDQDQQRLKAYRGPIGMGWLRTKDGRFLPLEFNMRYGDGDPTGIIANGGAFSMKTFFAKATPVETVRDAANNVRHALGRLGIDATPYEPWQEELRFVFRLLDKRIDPTKALNEILKKLKGQKGGVSFKPFEAELSEGSFQTYGHVLKMHDQVMQRHHRGAFIFVASHDAILEHAKMFVFGACLLGGGIIAMRILSAASRLLF